MTFEKYALKLSACLASEQEDELYKKLSTRANNLRKAMADGAVQESSAIDHLHRFASELISELKEFRDLDKLMKVSYKNRTSRYKYSSPTTAREKRGDFNGKCYDGSVYPWDNDGDSNNPIEQLRKYGDGIQVHSLRLATKR